MDSVQSEKADDREKKRYLPDLTKAKSLILSKINVLRESHSDLKGLLTLIRSSIITTSRILRIRVVSMLSSLMYELWKT